MEKQVLRREDPFSVPRFFSGERVCALADSCTAALGWDRIAVYDVVT
jgi:hypothetical protein